MIIIICIQLTVLHDSNNNLLKKDGKFHPNSSYLNGY